MQIRINGADPVPCVGLIVDYEQIDITTAFEADPTWNYTDPAGHYHARSTVVPLLPTLLAYGEHVDCDDPEHDNCEGYTKTTYRCIVCDAEVKPGMRPTTGQRFTRGRESWSVEVDQPVPDGERVSVVVDTPQGRRFGFAVPVSVDAEGGPDGIRIRTRLAGASPLGRQS